MALCVNQSGTWREITTNCVNVSGTWRNIETGCINQSGTWRCYGFFNIANCPLGSNAEGGYLICKSSGTAWIVAPSSSEVTRTWYSRNDANTRAQQVSGCSGWFVPSCTQLYSPGYTCRTYWNSYSADCYWSDSQGFSFTARLLDFSSGSWLAHRPKHFPHRIRAFRCVTY